MPDFLKEPFQNGPSVAPLDVLVRLVVALGLGALVAWVYCRTRKRAEVLPSLPPTLVLLAILIAMVTQVIGDSVARAFSLVGALSIVRFRTIVRDTQDTAYVIFAVVVGMAVGARNPWVATIGLAITGLAAFLMMARTRQSPESQPPVLLELRVGLGHDVEQLVGATLDTHLQQRELVSIGTARQGVALDVKYQARLLPQASPDELIKALNRVEGIQNARLDRRDVELD